jgi:hypothetical protein
LTNEPEMLRVESQQIDALYSQPQEFQKVVCPVPISCDYEECSHKKPHVRNNKCAMGCLHSGSPDCIPIPESLASTEMLEKEIALKLWCENTSEKLSEWTWEDAQVNAPISTRQALKDAKFVLNLCQFIIAKNERQKAFRELGELMMKHVRVEPCLPPRWVADMIAKLKSGQLPRED